MTGRWKYLAVGGLVLALGLMLYLPAAPGNDVSWVAVSSHKLEHEIGLVGKIEPIETSIITAPFEGLVLANELSPGMQVEQGQALLSLDTALLEIKLRDALANQLKMQQTVEIYRTWATDPQVLDATLGLPALGLRSVVGAAVGWRSSEDFNAALPKSRLAQEQVLTWL